MIVISPCIVGSSVSNSTTCDDLGVGHEPHEPAVERVGLRARLARGRGLVVGQRDPERASLARVERVDLARHPVGHHPLLDRVGVEQGAVDRAAGRPDVSRQPCHSHGREANARRSRRAILRRWMTCSRSRRVTRVGPSSRATCSWSTANPSTRCSCWSRASCGSRRSGCRSHVVREPGACASARCRCCSVCRRPPMSS